MSDCSNFSKEFPQKHPADFADDAPIPERLQELVNAELMDGETIRWIEQPIPRYFSAGTIRHFLVGIFFTGFGLYWTASLTGLLHDGVGLLHLLFASSGPVFLLAGLLRLAAPLWRYRNEQRTVYVITDRRAIIVQGTFWSHHIKSGHPADISRLSCRQRANGTGDLFNCYDYCPDKGFIRREHGFMNIRNVKEVERMLLELKGAKSQEKKT